MSKQIRILQVGLSPNYGGTEAFVMEQYRHIDRHKVQFDFLNVFGNNIACSEEILNLGGHIYNLDMSRHGKLSTYYSRLGQFFSNHSHEFNGVHCNFQSLINIDLLKYSKKFDIPIRIAHSHNAGYGKNPNLLQHLTININKRNIHKYATHFFACSSLAADWMFPKNAPTVIIHNAIDLSKFEYNDSIRIKQRKLLKLSDDDRVVLFVGRLDPQKNPKLLIEIFSEVIKLRENTILFIAGEGYLKNEINEMIYEMNLHEKIHLLGHRNDVCELMQVADVFLLPSRFEGLGIVLLEAQASGLPSFTSKGVVPDDVNITNLIHYLSLESSPMTWAKEIVKLLSTNYQRHSYSAVLSESGYDSRLMAKKLENFYLESSTKSSYF